MTWQSLQEPISHISQQSDTSMWRQRDREKYAIFFVSCPTEERFDSFCQPEVQSQFSLSSLCRSLTRTQDGWWLAIYCKPDFSQANCFPVWHSCLSKGFKLSIYTVIKKLLSSVSAILHSDCSSENSLLPLRCKMYRFNVVKVPACNIAKSI